MQPLDPFSHPLVGTSLIEASAGTGKTYTMAALYLRLLLNIGENMFGRALNVEQILVMTFTEAATQELKERIRARIVELLHVLEHWKKTGEVITRDPFLLALFAHLQDDVDTAILRLDMAQQNMDSAAIFTIHGFCRRMLNRYAFDADIHFNATLISEDDLRQRYLQFCREYWRETYYPQSAVVSRYVHKYLQSPEAVLQRISPLLEGELPLKTIASFEQLIKHIHEINIQIADVKAQWYHVKSAVYALISESISQGQLNANSYRANQLETKLHAVECWLESAVDFDDTKAIHYLSQKNLTSKTKKGKIPPEHPFFVAIDHLIDALAQFNSKGIHNALHWHYVLAVREKQQHYSRQHSEMSFADLLTRLRQALQSVHGERLAQLIRLQFPFAMVDEFQDTDSEQFHILEKLYLDAPQPTIGLIMIGDPKQSIYRFRSADIYTYLNAKKRTAREFTLATNWRSSESAVDVVNQLFSACDNAFIVSDIAFSPVHSAGSKTAFLLNGDVQPPLCAILSDVKNKDQFKQTQAQACAISVQHYLQHCAQGTLWGENQQGDRITLAPQDFAILVRTGNEAQLIKAQLQSLGIQSVFLSEKSAVFQSPWARILFYVLQGCLTPYHRQHVLNALSSELFNFDSFHLSQLLYDEQLWDSWVERFTEWQQLWQKQGVLPMIHAILQYDNLAQTILAKPDGERAITDILHLAELLQAQMNEQPNPFALLTWFDRHIRQTKQSDDVLRQRLESERDLVKIVTIHGSKGLEYGVVWLPFIGLGVNSHANTLKKFNNQGQTDIALDDSAADQILREDVAEEMRLLYVALTRAVYQIHLGLYTQFYQNKTVGDSSWGWNPLVYLLSRGALGIDLKQKCGFDSRTLLQESLRPEQYQVICSDAMEPSDWRAQTALEQGQAAHFMGEIEKDWRIHSFTSLSSAQHNHLHGATSFDDSLTETPEQPLDYQLVLPDMASEPLPHTEAYSPFHFPAGTRAGDVLHTLLQRWDMRIEADNQAHIQFALQALALDENWAKPLQLWFENMLNTPWNSPNTLCLRDITPQKSLREMEFLLSITSRVNMAKFNTLLRQYPLKTGRTALEITDFKGMLRGFIDLVCEYEGQYYVVDYKSNLIGDDMAYYDIAQLSAVVALHRYDLQYLLYTLALHRYLKYRLADYHYERDFGGVYYLFLRGMNGENSQTGIYFDKPHFALIDGLDKLFSE
ncbi:exodeoxyribonuclease V subunit beta [Spirabiliibacterium falconis]|uniref:exodeoxyribonuclease V subunit beta n=1 Tax=Spirabiliibacterium falconis TaxID=572023 RepID=UPI001AACE944|nr:exodeoxyribonuclease V subunit beta [Spirabiliibacterium falconis]MBE2895162.1 exodeoxyribonuclease V subunit beta [Spirabiliibacterium falconis]